MRGSPAAKPGMDPLAYGELVAQRLFARRATARNPNQREVHIGRKELAALIAASYEQGLIDASSPASPAPKAVTSTKSEVLAFTALALECLCGARLTTEQLKEELAFIRQTKVWENEGGKEFSS